MKRNMTKVDDSNWKSEEKKFMHKAECWRKDNIIKLLVALWNKHVPIGTKVKYYPIAGEEKYICEETRTPAWILSNGEALVSITGRSGGVALSHIELVEAPVSIAPCKKCGTVPPLGSTAGNLSIGHSCMWEKGQPLDWWQGSIGEWNKRNEC